MSSYRSMKYSSVQEITEIIAVFVDFRSQVGELHASLLSSEGSDEVHQRRREGIISVQSVSLELGADSLHTLGVISLLDDGRHETGELGLLPALLLGKLSVDEVEAVEGVSLLDAAVHVNATVGAGVALDDSGGIDDLQLGGIGLNGEVVARNNTDDGEEGASGLPALRATASVVVGNVAFQRNNDLV